MTEKELAVIVQAIGPMMREAVEKAVQDAHTRIAVLESQQKTLSDARDRVLILEAKSTALVPEMDLSGIRDQLSALHIKQEISTAANTELLTQLKARADTVNSVKQEISGLRERIAVVEVRPAVPGPVGPPGKDGEPGKDGLAGLSYEGVYQEGKSYELGQMVTWAGSMWHCNESTFIRPGEGSKAWTLTVKRGRDGKDGTNGLDLHPVVKAG